MHFILLRIKFYDFRGAHASVKRILRNILRCNESYKMAIYKKCTGRVFVLFFIVKPKIDLNSFCEQFGEHPYELNCSKIVLHAYWYQVFVWVFVSFTGGSFVELSGYRPLSNCCSIITSVHKYLKPFQRIEEKAVHSLKSNKVFYSPCTYC